jgi:hydroxymethylpyrimidine/phosphomethylpyrimidine kinase
VPPDRAVLVIGGTDPVNGAGVTADVQTLARLGVRAAVAVTAVLVQDTRGVSALHAVPPELIAAQIRAAAEDLSISAVKVGLVPTAGGVRAVADALAALHQPFVLDPVRVASGGQHLLENDALPELRDLARRATLVTPNRDEAAALWGDDRPPVPALLTDGDGSGRRIRDTLYVPGGRTRTFLGTRHPGPGVRGTGCRLATAVAAGLASGLGLEEAVARGLRFTRRSYRTAVMAGHGLRLFSTP